MTTVTIPPSPTRSISMDAPWRWLGAGFRDLMRAPVLSIGYGFLVIGGGISIVFALWQSGQAPLIPVAFGMFAIFGPMLAVGLYELSRRIESGEKLALYPIRLVGARSTLHLAYVGFFLMFAALVWARMAMLLYALFTNGIYLPIDQFVNFAVGTGPGLAMITIGTIIGAGIAFVFFVISVVSIPTIMNEKMDAFSAIGVSIVAVRNNFGAMVLWAWLIAVITAAGIGTFFIGLAVAFPLLGHATWHAYRDIRGGKPID